MATEKDTQKDSGQASEEKDVAGGASKVTKKSNKKSSKKISKKISKTTSKKANKKVSRKAKRPGDSSASTGKTAKTVSSKVDSRNTDSVAPVTTAAKESTESPQETPVNPASPPTSGKGLSVAALLLSLLALSGAGYAWYQTAVNARLAGGEQSNRIAALESRLEQNYNSQSGVAEQLSDLRQLVGNTESGLSAQISDIRTQANQQQQDIESEVASVREDFTTLKSSISDVRKELGSSIDQWEQREVEHLLTIANQRLQLSGDHESALAALQLADARLKELDDPTLLNVRQILSSEIAQLTGISAPDIVSATTTITLLSKTLGDLPLKGETRVPAAVISESGDNATAQPESNSTSEEIVNIGRTFLSDLGTMVQVEKGGESVAPTITPEVARMTVALGQLILEGAQVALIRSQPEIFSDRLDAASSWVSEKFQGDSEVTAKWLGQLDELKELSPEVTYPDISGSLKAMRSATQTEG